MNVGKSYVHCKEKGKLVQKVWMVNQVKRKFYGLVL